MDTSIEQEDNLAHGLEARRPPLRRSNERPAKGVLKSTNTHSSAAVVPSKSHSIIRESAGSSHGLLISGQNGVAPNDEEFDLDGAINEMGSFLSTWDEEKCGVRVA